jgi:hypothetical protein
MKIKDIKLYLESIAPTALQENYDNSGLIVGNENDEVNGAILTLDCTEEVVDEAIAKKDKWLVYGGGITAGYRLKAWSKQKSEEQGKVKMRLSEGFNNFNSCLMGEIGIEGVIKFYGSYQLTSIYDNGLDMKPICIGVRILGI